MKKTFVSVSIIAGFILASMTTLSSCEENKNKSTGNFETVEVTTGTSTKSDWDEVLDEYEKFVDKYIAFAKKVKEGDMSAMDEYASYMEQAITTCEKLENAKGEMTSTQIKRYTKILTKMSSIAAY